MKKVVLIFDYMPNKCSECTLSCKHGDDWVCGGYDIKVYIDFNSKTRHSHCPLKEMQVTD